MQIICSVFYGSVEYCFLPVLEYLVSDINEHNGEQLLYWERKKKLLMIEIIEILLQ